MVDDERSSQDQNESTNPANNVSPGSKREAQSRLRSEGNARGRPPCGDRGIDSNLSSSSRSTGQVAVPRPSLPVDAIRNLLATMAPLRAAYDESSRERRPPSPSGDAADGAAPPRHPPFQRGQVE